MDIIVTDEKDIILTVPGRIPPGDLVLSLEASSVTLSAAGARFVEVAEVEDPVLDALAEKAEIPLIEITDPDTPPARITHTAKINDNRGKLQDG